MLNDKNIIFGGPIPKNGLEQCSSLGELFLKKLKELGESVLLVSFCFLFRKSNAI